MTTEELRKHLAYLTENYVQDEAIKTKLFGLIARDNVPAKGILAEVTPFLSGKISADDGELVKDIAYWFC